MACFVILGAFSTYILLTPAQPIRLILEIMELTTKFKVELLIIALINIIACFAFDRFGERPVNRTMNQLRRMMRRRRKTRHENQYRAIDGQR